MLAKSYCAIVVLAVCTAAVAGQFLPGGGIRQVPARGSVSKAATNAYQREINYGGVEFGQGVSNSRAVTKTNGGVRNGGTTSVSRSNAVSRDVDIGGVNIGGTLTRSQTRTNGAVSRGVAYDGNIGNLGFGASLSPQNLQNGFGLMQQPGGGVSLGLGLLNLDLSRNAQQNSNTLSQAQVNAQGRNAKTRANANTQTNTQNYGGVGVTTTQSRSNAVGRTQVGRTSALTGGVGDNIATNAATRGVNYYRPQRAAVAPNYGRLNYAARPALVRRPRRDTQYAAGGDPTNQYNARVNQQRRQTQYELNQSQQHPSTINNRRFYYYNNNNSNNNNTNASRRNGVGAGAGGAVGVGVIGDSSTRMDAAELDDLNNATIQTAAEQFDHIDGSETKGRTFSFITDLIDNITNRCVYPCTVDAYRQNRCCEAVIIAPPQQPVCCAPPPRPPPPPPPPPAVCCAPPAVVQYPIYVPQPLPRRRIVVVPTGVPIDCCVTCPNNNGFFGPPPCVRYGIGGASIGTITGTSVSAWGSSSSNVVNNVGNTLVGAGNIGMGSIGGLTNAGIGGLGTAINVGANVAGNIGQRIPIAYAPYIPPILG